MTETVTLALTDAERRPPTFRYDYGTCYRCGKPCDAQSVSLLYDGDYQRLCADCWGVVFKNIKPLEVPGC